jgi:hypothetical protein
MTSFASTTATKKVSLSARGRGCWSLRARIHTMLPEPTSRRASRPASVSDNSLAGCGAQPASSSTSAISSAVGRRPRLRDAILGNIESVCNAAASRRSDALSAAVSRAGKWNVSRAGLESRPDRSCTRRCSWPRRSGSTQCTGRRSCAWRCASTEQPKIRSRWARTTPSKISATSCNARTS